MQECLRVQGGQGRQGVPSAVPDDFGPAGGLDVVVHCVTSLTCSEEASEDVETLSLHSIWNVGVRVKAEFGVFGCGVDDGAWGGLGCSDPCLGGVSGVGC